MEADTKQKAKKSSTYRVVLSEESEKHLAVWLEEIVQNYPGIQVKKQDLVNWLIKQKGESLNGADLKSVRDQFYDEIKLAQWALSQLRTAKARNEKVALADLLKGGKNGVSERPRQPRKKVSKPSEMLPQIEQPQTGGQA